MKRENEYQRGLIKRIKQRFEGCLVLKNDPGYIQGIPDLQVIFPNGKTVFLEVKNNERANHQPNQDYYINLLDGYGFLARFVFPENEEDILNEMERSFRSCR